MNTNMLNKHHLKPLSLKRGGRGLSESSLVMTRLNCDFVQLKHIVQNYIKAGICFVGHFTFPYKTQWKARGTLHSGKSATIRESNHGLGHSGKSATIRESNHGSGHSGKSATIRELNHGSGVCKEHYVYSYVPKSSILLAGTGV